MEYVIQRDIVDRHIDTI
jgi:SnoaL-like domain